MKPRVLLATFFAVAVRILPAAEIELLSGEVLEATVVAEGDAAITIEQEMGGSTVQLELPRKRIHRLRESADDPWRVVTARPEAEEPEAADPEPAAESRRDAEGGRHRPTVPAGRGGLPYVGFRYDNTGVFPADARPPTEFDGPSRKNLLWSVPLPNFGNASPLVVAGSDGKARVFTLVDHGWPLGEGDTPVLLCHDADTGEELWKRAIDPLDAMPPARAQALRVARHKYWAHMHEAGRLHYQYHFEAESDAEREAIKAEAAEHVPDKGHNKPVKKYFGKPSKGARMQWTSALNHPDCAPLHKAGILGVSSWNWTGIGQAMCTPVSDGEAVYVVTGLRTVTKFALDGEVLWHVFQEDAELTKFYECWLANGLHILPVEIGGEVRKLLVYELYSRLWGVDCASGRVVWQAPTSNIGGHVCGTPQLLRLPNAAGEEELLVVTRSGHIVRARDGEVLTEYLFNVNYAGPLSDGRDRLWIQQRGGDGGHFHPHKGSVFDKKCVAGLRFRMEDGKLAWDRMFYDEESIKRPMGGWLGFVRGEEILSKDLARTDAATGATIADGPRGFGSYNGTVFAGGHFYAVPRMVPAEKTKNRHWNGSVDAAMVVNVAKDNGSSISFVGTCTVEVIERDPEDPAERDQRMALTGRIFSGEWYCWHAAYVAPFAYGNRLYVRSFDNLYCFGTK